MSNAIPACTYDQDFYIPRYPIFIYRASRAQQIARSISNLLHLRALLVCTTYFFRGVLVVASVVRFVRLDLSFLLRLAVFLFSHFTFRSVSLSVRCANHKNPISVSCSKCAFSCLPFFYRSSTSSTLRSPLFCLPCSFPTFPRNSSNPSALETAPPSCSTTSSTTSAIIYSRTSPKVLVLRNYIANLACSCLSAS